MFTGISLKQITINDRSQGLPTHRVFLLLHFLQDSLGAVSKLRLVCLVWTLGAPAGLRGAAVDTRNTKQQPAHTNGGTFKLNIATHLHRILRKTIFFKKYLFLITKKTSSYLLSTLSVYVQLLALTTVAPSGGVSSIWTSTAPDLWNVERFSLIETYTATCRDRNENFDQNNIKKTKTIL